MLDHINWNPALTLGAYTVVVFWIAVRPTQWLYTRLRRKIPSRWSRCIIAVASMVICVLGASLSLAMLGVMSAYGMHLLGLRQNILVYHP